MAKSKSQDENEHVTYQGKVVDPEIQKKVESYMELSDEELEAANIPVIKKPKGKKIKVSNDDEKGDEASSTAPLLPTDKLPGGMVGKSKKPKEPEEDNLETEEIDNKQDEESSDEDETGNLGVPPLANIAGAASIVEPHDEKKPDSDSENVLGEQEPEEVAADHSRDEEDDSEADSPDESQDKPEDLKEQDEEPKDVESSEDNDVEETENEDMPEDSQDESLASGEEEADSENEVDKEEPEVDEEESTEEEREGNPSVEENEDELDVDTEEEVNKFENEPEKLVGPAGALWTKYQGKTLADVDKLPSDDPETKDDPETEEAIKEIIAEDSDTLLGIEDKKRSEAKSEPINVKKKHEALTVGGFFKAWFKNPFYRKLTILALAIIIAALVAIPTTRYFLLNTFGVRVSTSVRVLDSKTDLPLKNVEFIVDGKSSKTDIDGNVALEGIKLGRQQLVIKKPAFAELDRDVTLGWGSNPLGDFEIEPVGSQYRFILTDFLSDKPVREGELVYEESSARFSAEGEAIITIPTVNKEEIEIEVISEDYRTENIKVSTITKQDTYSVVLVPAKQHVFYSKRSGKVDLFKTDVDGKNQKVILEGSGIEKDDSLGIAPHPEKDIVAFSSSRENVRNGDGFLLNTLQIINLENNEITKLAQSERIQIIDWVGDRLIYVKIAEGASQVSTDRHRLISYNIETGQEDELASTNYFNDVISVNGAIYYSPALYQVNGSVGLFKVNADGSDKKTIFNKEVWNIFRTEYDKASISVGKDWYELNLNDDNLSKVGGAPSVLKSRLYIDSPNGKQSLWVDERDGKSVLISYDKDNKEDRVLVTESGIQPPLRWLDDDHIVYRVENGQETADYVMSLGGGIPEKIADVTSSYGIDRWYYF